MTLKQRQETEPSSRLRPEGSCPFFPSELWYTVHVVFKANVERLIANLFLHGRTLRVPGRKGLEEEGNVGVDHPLLSSLNLSMPSGDFAPKLRMARSLCRRGLVPSEEPSVRLQGRWRKKPASRGGQKKSQVQAGQSPLHGQVLLGFVLNSTLQLDLQTLGQTWPKLVSHWGLAHSGLDPNDPNGNAVLFLPY